MIGFSWDGTGSVFLLPGHFLPPPLPLPPLPGVLSDVADLHQAADAVLGLGVRVTGLEIDGVS
jgi:hypothetical protein